MTNSVDSTITFIITTLASGLWQAPLFALAAWLVLRICPSTNATTRHSVLAAALIASLALPIVTATVITFAHAPVAPAAVAMHGTRESLAPKNVLPYKPVELGASVPARSNPDDTIRQALLTAPALARLTLSVPRPLAIGMVALWFAGAAFAVIRLILGLAHLERLKRDALPLPVAYRARLTRWAATSKGSRAVRLCTSDEIEIPIAVGLFDALILIPNRLLEELDAPDIDRIVLHELAHLRRADDWFNAVSRFAQAFLFFNPGILWLNAQLDLEREVACDDWVLQQNDALPYASCLAKVVETAVWPFRAMTAPGAFVTRRGMSVRIERLLAKQRDVRVRTSFGPAGAVVGMLAVLGGVAALVSPSIAYGVTESTPAATVATTSERKPVARPSAIVHTMPDSHVATIARPVVVADTVSPLPAHASTQQQQAPDSSPRLIPDAIARAIRRSAEAATTASVGTSRADTANASAVAEAASASSAAAIDALSKLSSPPQPPQPGPASASSSEVIADATSPDFIDDMASVGYTNLSVDELMQLKSLGVSADFVRSLQRQGISHPPVSELLQLRATGVDPEYVGDMRRRFGAGLAIHDILGMKAVGVTPDYIDQLAAAGLKNPSPSRLEAMRALNVSPAYIHDLATSGFVDVPFDDLMQMKALGIDGAFIARAHAHGFHTLTVRQLVGLKTTGIL